MLPRATENTGGSHAARRPVVGPHCVDYWQIIQLTSNKFEQKNNFLVQIFPFLLVTVVMDEVL